MGNAAILRTEVPVKDLERPDRPSIRWRVYQLREAGVQLSRNAAIATGKIGRLEIVRWPDNSLVATLLDRDDMTLNRLHWVQLRWLKPDNQGMLLHGRESVTVRGGGLKEVGQAWWCVVTTL